jgi:cytochrome P450
MEFILGVDPKQEDDGRPLPVSAFNKAWNSALISMGLRLLLEGSGWMLPKAQYVKASAKLHSFVDFAIGQSKARNLKSTPRTKGEKKAVVDAVIPQARDDVDARWQLMEILLANQDTTATLVCNTIQILALNPDVWEQLRAEVMGKGPDFMTFDGLRGSRLLNNILMEALRVRPVFPIVGRRALCDLTLPTGGGPNGDQPLHCPAGTNSLVNFWSMNLNSDVFGPDAHAFKPERWDKIRPSPREFSAFGMGGRSCLGKEKALADASYLLARLAQKFEGLEGSAEFKPAAQLSMRNAAGYKIAFHTGKEDS